MKFEKPDSSGFREIPGLIRVPSEARRRKVCAAGIPAFQRD